MISAMLCDMLVQFKGHFKYHIYVSVCDHATKWRPRFF